MTLVIAASAALPGRAATRQGHGGAPLALLDVPFLSQSEALCGGAAAAMVLRYWGERGVAAEDFAPLVDRRAGGITTDALVRSLRARGWGARELGRSGEPLRREVAGGHPVIALIEDRPGTYHYVVIVGSHERAVVVHDPARAPFRVMAVEEFERRWQAADRWALVVRPLSSPATSEVPETSEVDGTETARVVNSCDADVRHGVELAQKNDLAGAERVLADAVYRCGGAAPLRELAGVRLLQRRWPEVADLAHQVLRSDPADSYAAKLLGTSRFVQGDAPGALAAWNLAGEPTIDLISIDGLDRTRFRAVERHMDVRAGTLLTPQLLERTRQQLKELPMALTATTEYVPVEQGRAELRVHVVERPLMPRGALHLAALGARTAVRREITWPIASLSGGGELLSASWRFWPDRPRYGVTLSAPLPIGIIHVEAYGERQPFSGTAAPPSARAGGWAGLSQWATSRVRWTLRAGGDRWRTSGTFGGLGASVRTRISRADIDVGTTIWTGPATFAATRVTGDWRSSREQTGTVLHARVALERIDGNAPMDLWPAGDVGHARTTLLRAHPVLDGGRLRIDRLGRTLHTGSVGIVRWLPALGPLRTGVDGFLDTGLTGRRVDNTLVADADLGAGIRFALPGMSGAFQVNAARGLRDGHHAVSLLWTEP